MMVEVMGSSRSGGEEAGNVKDSVAGRTKDRVKGTSDLKVEAFSSKCNVLVIVKEKGTMNASSLNNSSDVDARNPTSSLTIKNYDAERQMLEVANTSTIDTLSRKGEDGMVNEMNSAKTNEPVLEVKECFVNSVFEFFLWKRVVFHVVKNNIKNVWSRFGLVRTMMNEKGIFFFKFSSITDLKSVLILIKLYDVPITSFTTDGLSVIATKLGIPLMLYSYTTAMRMKSWVRSSFVRVVIDLRADVELNDTLVLVVPKLKGN
nr:hypothetical protein [Tanacetum cinerariifolium]